MTTTGSAVKRHGGKHFLARKIVAMFPVHHTYVEPFGGSAGVLLHKPSSPVEIFNDLDRELVNFFLVLRDRYDELIRRLTLTPYSEGEFRAAGEPAGDPVERARRFLVRNRQSLGARGTAFARSTSARSRRGMADNVSAWLSAIDENLPAMVQRLRRVELCRMPALEVIRKYDSPQTLFYCDPPYVPGTRSRSSRNVYPVEMTDQDHRELAKVLHACQARVVISGNPSPLYEELYRGWPTLRFEVANHAAHGRSKKRRHEQVWLNFSPRAGGSVQTSNNHVSTQGV